MKKEKAVFLSGLCFLLFALFFSKDIVYAEEAAISFFYYNACASCDEEEVFTELLQEKLLPIKQQYPYAVNYYNTFRAEEKKRYDETVEALGLDGEKATLPIAVIGSQSASGYEEMEEELTSMLMKTKNAEAMPAKAVFCEDAADGEETVKALLESGGYYLFTTDSCKDCERVKSYVDNLAEKEKIVEKSVLNQENLLQLQTLFAAYGVPGEEQQVPVLFGAAGYASGKEEIMRVLTGSGKLKLGSGTADAVAGGGTVWQMFSVGLLNGLNPCALSMLFFLLSLLTGARSSVLRPGIGYLLGKWCAYFVMGAGFFKLFDTAKTNWELGFGFLKYIMLAAALLLAIMNSLDFINVLRKSYGKVKVQLPKKLRKWNHDMIKKVAEGRGGYFVLVIFLLSIVISAGEFFCTGQIYAAALFLLAQTNGTSALLLCKIAVYVTALCLPSLAILLFVHKTGNLLKASNQALAYMPVIKFLYSLVFLGAAVVMAYLL